MDKKVYLITGGKSGIGKAAAIQIAQEGFRVIIGCRNKVRGYAALNEIREKGNSDDVELLLIDMGSQESIKNAARELNSNNSKLDVLIHNAADFDISRKSPPLFKGRYRSCLGDKPYRARSVNESYDG